MANIIKFSLVMAVLASACSPQATGNEVANVEKGSPSSATVAHIEGWQSLNFGMTFDQALTAESNIRWYGVAECQVKMALEGCSLGHDSLGSYVPLMAGVNLTPRLSFNKTGVLTDISLMQTFDDISKADCESIHSRLAEHLGRTYGQGSRTGKEPPTQQHQVVSKTPGGFRYTVLNLDSGSMIAGVDEFAQHKDGSKIDLLFSHITVDNKGICSPSVSFGGPQKLERAPIGSLEMDTNVSLDMNLVHASPPRLVQFVHAMANAMRSKL